MCRRYWSPKEDQTLEDIINKIGQQNWTLVARKMSEEFQGQTRNSKQCRQRWINKLSKQNTTEEPWSSEQDKIILSQFLKNHIKEKNIWIYISERINSQIIKESNISLMRCPNQTKNRFYSLIRKGIRRINNQLGRPITADNIRLLKPRVISKLFEIVDQNESHQFLEIIYNRTYDEPSLRIHSTQRDNQKLSKLLNLITNLNTDMCKPKNEMKKNSVVKIQKLRKSSLSTIQSQKIENSQIFLINIKMQQVQKEKEKEKEKQKAQMDYIDLFIGNLVESSLQSIQFMQMQFDF